MSSLLKSWKVSLFIGKEQIAEISIVPHYVIVLLQHNLYKMRF